MATKILTIGISEETWKKIKKIAALKEELCRLQGAFYGGPFSWNEDSRGRNS